MAISLFLANELLDHVLGVGAYAAPTVYLAVSTTDPASALTEPAGAGYTRVALAAKFSPAVAKASSNTALISMPQATGSWGTITHFAVCDALGTGAGNVLWSGLLTTAKPVSNLDTLSFAISNLTMSFT